MKQRAQKIWRSTKNLFIDYSEHSTIHGVNYASERHRSCLERFCWLVAVCVSVLFCAKLIYDAWQISPIIISFTAKPTPIWQVPFPAITICPTVPTESERLKAILRFVEKRNMIPYDAPKEDLHLFQAVNTICKDTFYFGDSAYGDCNRCLQLLREVKIPPKDLFFGCKFQDQVIDCQENLVEVVTETGWCYTFNGLGVFRKNGSNPERASQAWTIDEGYDSNAPLDTYPHRATEIGAKFGFSILMGYRKTALSQRMCDQVARFLVGPRMQHDFLQSTTEDIVVNMGKSVDVVVSPELMISSKELLDYTIDVRKCYFSEERTLKYFEKYTQANCEVECAIKNALQFCNCSLFFVENKEDSNACSGPWDRACLYDFNGKNENPDYVDCGCLPSCAAITFNTEVFKNDLNISNLKKTHEINDDFIYSELSVYFKHNQFMTSQRSELYGQTDFLANCGGLLGSFLGVSVISFMELVYFCSIRCFFNQDVEDHSNDVQEEATPKPGLLREFKGLIADYSTKSTIQGLNYMVNAKLSKLERLWWAIVLLISVYFCESLVSDILERFNSTPVVITFAKDEIPISDIPFPAVTVCPQVPATKLKENYKYLKEANISLYHLDQNEIDIMTVLAQVCDSEVIRNIDPQNKTNCNRCSEALFEATGSLDHFYKACQFQGFPIPYCKGFFNKVITEEGVCFTFNKLTVHRQPNYDENSEQWTLESGFRDNDEWEDRYPFVGTKHHLSLQLFEYKSMIDHWCKGWIRGFRLFLHMPNEVPQISKHHYLVPYNYMTQLTVQPKMIVSEPELKDITIDKRQCFFSNERYLRFFQHYTQANCDSECTANMTIERCDCLRFHMPRIPGFKLCGISDIKCYQSVAQLIPASACNCLPACTSITYEAEVSQFLQPLLGNNAMNTGVFFVSFKAKQFVALQRSQIFGVTELVANCGGLLGLFLGFSFMSIVELVYFCTVRLVCNVKHQFHR